MPVYHVLATAVPWSIPWLASCLANPVFMCHGNDRFTIALQTSPTAV